MTRRRLVVALLLALAAPACGGPRAQLEVGVKEIDTDVLIGPRRPQPSAAPTLGPNPGPVGFPGFVQPPIDTGPRPPVEPPPVCPAADPLSPIALEAATTADAPPAARTYPFRNTGTWSLGERTGVFPATATRTIGNVTDPAPEGGFSFDVSIPDRAGSTTTTTYHVYPAPATAADPESGLYVERVVTRSPGEPDRTFTPTPSLLILRFPASGGSSWSSRGVDPLTQTVESFDARVAGKAVIDACGTKLQAWKVDITAGQITSPTTTLSFAATLWIAPQYGGLLLRDKLDQQGTIQESATSPEIPLQSSNTAVITVAPVRPA